jgi:hypothetical protein
MPIVWGQAYEEDNIYYWCTENIPFFNGSKIAVPVQVIEYDSEQKIPYFPLLLITIGHDNILYRIEEIFEYTIDKVACLHFKSELKYHDEALEQSKKINSGIFQPQVFFNQLMEDYDKYF